MLKSRLNWLLLLIPVSIALKFFYPREELLFFVAAFSILPLANLLGRVTEELAKVSGPRLGGFLNASLGNLAELIITIFAILALKLEVVKASITGSIIGNILLVLGLSILLGGLKKKEQVFNRALAGVQSSMLVLAVIALMVPAIFAQTPAASPAKLETLSLGVAFFLILTYVGGLFFIFLTHKSFFGAFPEKISSANKKSPLWLFFLLSSLAALVALESEFLVGSIEAVKTQLGLTELFIGAIIIPLVGNAAEHSSAIILALKDKMDLSLDIATSSSIQIALLVVPLLVFLSFFLGAPLTLLFNQLELAAIAFSVAIVTFISLDGKSNWLEGAQLLAAYLILALAFYLT